MNEAGGGEGRHRHVVESDLYDVWAFWASLRRFRPLAELAAEGEVLIPFFLDLLEDMFRILYKEVPVTRSEEEILPPHLPQLKVLRTMIQQGWVDQFRPTTELHEEVAAAATEALGRALLEQAQGKSASDKGREEAKDLDQDALGERLRQMVEEAAQQQSSESPESPEEGEQEDEEGEGSESDEEGKESGEEGGEPKPSADDLREELKSRIQAAAWPLEKRPEDEKGDQGEEGSVAKLGGDEDWGLGGGRYSFSADPDAFTKALRWIKDLRRLATALSRLLQTSFRKRLERVPFEAEEIYDVEMGRDLQRLLPSEWVGLACPDLEDAFWARFVQGELLQYCLRAKMPIGDGSKIFLVDLSYSVCDELHVRQGLEKVIAAALLLSSRKNEAYAVIFFHDDRVEPPLVLLDNPPTVGQWVDIATRWGEGGTNVVPPLMKAINLIATDPRFWKADIVLLTDGLMGNLSISAEFREYVARMKQELKFSLVAILVDWLGEASDEHVLSIADQVFAVSDLLTEEELVELTAILSGGEMVVDKALA